MKEKRKFIGFLADSESKMELRHLADTNDMTMSEIMRDALDLYLEEVYHGRGFNYSSKKKGES